MHQFESPYFAAIDLGSNSFHMLVVRVAEDKIEIIDREKEMVQIARGILPDGSLSPEAQEKAVICLNRFSERLRVIPNSQIRVVGTKTLRAITNAKSFIRAAHKALGVPIEIISGYEEARLVYAGLSHTLTNDDQKRLVIDIGGGSTEFIIGTNDEPLFLESLALGCVTYSEKFILHSGGINPKTMKQAYLTACDELEDIRRNYLDEGWDITYGTSGTMRAIAQLLEPNDGGAVITKRSLNEFIAETINNGAIPSTNIPKLRREILPAGLAVLQAIFDELELEKIHVADATLKEGLIYDTIGRFSNHDARFETVELLQQRNAIDIRQAKRVSETALALWSQIDGPELSGVSRTKILNWAAQLHEIGLAISHSGYHHHGYYILKHSDLAGFGRYEQYILANLVRSHRRKLNANRFEGMDDTAIAAFIPLLVCLRLSVKLNRHREDVKTPLTLTFKENTYTLEVEGSWLEKHPLTLAGLHQEVNYFKNIDVMLKLHY